MKISDILSNSNLKTALIDGISTVFNVKKITFSLLTTLMLTAPNLSAFDNREISLANIDSSFIENIWDYLDIGDSSRISDEIGLLSDHTNTVVLILDGTRKRLPLLDEYNMKNQFNQQSHMDMVSTSLTKDLKKSGDSDVAIIEVNVFNSNDDDVLSTAFNNIEESLKKYPNKEFIVNMSLGDGMNVFGYVSYHNQIIDLIKKYPNIKIIKSAGNSTAELSPLHNLTKSIKFDKFSEFKKYTSSKPSLDEILHLFKDKSGAENFLSFFDSYKKLIDKESKVFEETIVFQEKLMLELESEDNSISQKNRLSSNLIIAQAFSPEDFVENFNNNPELKNNKQANELIYLLKSMKAMNGNTFSKEMYSFWFSDKNKNVHSIFEEKFSSFINKYQQSNPEFFQNGYVNSHFNDFTASNFRIAPTDIMRQTVINGRKFKFLANGSSTSAPIITRDVINQVRLSIFEREIPEKKVENIILSSNHKF